MEIGYYRLIDGWVCSSVLLLLFFTCLYFLCGVVLLHFSRITRSYLAWASSCRFFHVFVWFSLDIFHVAFFYHTYSYAYAFLYLQFPCEFLSGSCTQINNHVSTTATNQIISSLLLMYLSTRKNTVYPKIEKPVEVLVPNRDIEIRNRRGLVGW